MSRSAQWVWVFFALSVMGLAVSGEPVYARLALLWLLLLVSSWLIARLSLRGVQLHRSERTARAHVGDVFWENFVVQNQGRFPVLWVEVCDHAPLVGRNASRVLTWIGAREQRSFLARSRLTRRGSYPLGPTELIAGDPFGLFEARKYLPPTTELLVYPPLVEIQNFPGPQGALPGGDALQRLAVQITPNAAGVREYVPGDTLNRIHWPSSARRGRLMVKEFELDPLAEVWLCVDASADTHCVQSPAMSEQKWLFSKVSLNASLPPDTMEYAVCIAASLGQYFLRRGRAMGLISNGRRFKNLPPDRSGRQMIKVLETLAMLQADGEESFAAMVAAQARLWLPGTVVVLIVPDTCPGLAGCVDLLARLNLYPVVVSLAVSTFEGAQKGEAPALAICTPGVPVYRIACGDDLSIALSAGGEGAQALSDIIAPPC